MNQLRPAGEAPAGGGLAATVPRAASHTVATAALLGVATMVLVVALAASQGAYFPTSWGWGALLLLMPSAVAWAAGVAQPISRGRAAIVVATALIELWIVASLLWTSSPADTVLEAERGLLLVSTAVAGVTFVRPRRGGVLAGAVLAAIALVGTYSLATRVFPNRLGVFDPLGVYRLADPIGYWNGLAAFTAMGLVLAFVHVARAPRLAARAASAATVPILAATFYFTFGRAAWIALAAGVAVMVLLAADRAQLAAVLVTLLPTATLAIAAAARSPALTHQTATLAQAVADGHRLAKIVAALAVAAAVVECGRSWVGRRIVFSRSARTAFAVLCLLAVGVGIAAGVEAEGGARHLEHQVRTAFGRDPTASANLNARLFSLSANGRVELWRGAWRDARAHPWLGSGAGTYERYWLQHRPNLLNVRDAHSLYLEMLAELGPIGLGLVLLLFGVAAAACVRARRSALVPGIAGAVAVYAVHAAADWDWELAALGVVVVALITAAVAEGEPEQPAIAAAAPLRVVVTIVVVALALVAGAGLAGNAAVARSEHQAANGEWAAAASSAALAHRWMPWSSEPWLLLGQAQQGAGDVAWARASYAHGLRVDSRSWLLWLKSSSVYHGAARMRRLRAAARLNPRAPELAAAGVSR